MHVHSCVVLCLPLALCRPQQTHALCAQAVALPPFSFLGFLAWHAVNSLRKLRRAGVPTLAGQYLLLWAAAGLAAVNASLLMALAGQAVAGAAWTSVWLLTRAGTHRSATLCDHRARVATPCASQCLLLPLERCRPLPSSTHVCHTHRCRFVPCLGMPHHTAPHHFTPQRAGLAGVQVAIVLHPSLHIGGSTGRTAVGGLAATAAVLSASTTAVWSFGVRASLIAHAAGAASLGWARWSYWLVCGLAACIAYAALLVAPLMPWRRLVPAWEPLLAVYAAAVLALELLTVVGAALAGAGISAGACLFGAAALVRGAVQAPLMYVTFVRPFLAHDALDMDVLLYSEMRDAGCFDEDAEELHGPAGF